MLLHLKGDIVIFLKFAIKEKKMQTQDKFSAISTVRVKGYGIFTNQGKKKKIILIDNLHGSKSLFNFYRKRHSSWITIDHKREAS